MESYKLECLDEDLHLSVKPPTISILDVSDVAETNVSESEQAENTETVLSESSTNKPFLGWNAIKLLKTNNPTSQWSTGNHRLIGHASLFVN